MTTEIEDGVLAGAHSYWQTVNLTGMLRELDETGLEIVDNQKTSLQERRKLAEKTKAFRAIPDSEKLEEFKPLLRAYQHEIDALTKRMKFAENGFLKLFKSLSEAPDPEPFLAGLIDQRQQARSFAEQESECKRLQAKIDTLAAENQDLKEQMHRNESQQVKLQNLESSMDAMVREQISQREQEIKGQHEELIQHLKARESDLQRQLSAATRKLTEVQSSLDTEEAEKPVPSADRELVAKLAELEILQSDYDHANSRITDLQTQNSRLRAEISALYGGSEGGSLETLVETQQRVRELDEETKRLFNSLEKADAELALQKSHSIAKQNALEQQIQFKENELQRLQAEIQRCADYDEIKRDLDIMKSVEFAVSDWGLGDADMSDQPAAVEEPLERLLVKRNKELENRLTDTKNQLTQSQQELGQLQSQLNDLEDELKQKTTLAERLESDLLSIGNQRPLSTETAATVAQASSEQQNGIIGASTNDIEMKPASNLLEIVTGQRDRFRKRNIELEDELRIQAASVSELNRQVEQVKQDNVRLYEEIKYLRSYTSSTSHLNAGQQVAIGSTSTTAASSKFSSSSSHRIDMDTGVSAKYKGLYEESLNPFNAFHRRETSRRVRSMGILDRLIYMVSSFVVSNRRARMAMLLYAALLHMLVLVILYRSMLQADTDVHPIASP
ncbi:hypothetical protein H4R22_001966 [Coemansia sp. RSA 1290]|nr:hypothetical protein H4R22_001966 [Coemansia sp. RSA 1290]KAJ2651625.1 hypothetical protein IWW40_001525 [Coemansia sp. RSA 1250]